MSPIHNSVRKLLSILVIFFLVIAAFDPTIAQAQSDDIERKINAESGKVSFIGPAKGSVLPALRALGTFIRPQDPAMALAIQFAPEFGIQDPQRDLSEIKSITSDNGRITTRFQQNYQDIPIMAGELIVNTNENGDLYSINGEVSAKFSLATDPTIDSAQAKDTALAAVAKWYDLSASDLVATEPELWIFDESLLQPSNRPVELVWRLEVSAVDTNNPIRELVLINAHTGSMSFHFNQIDTAGHGEQPKVTEEPSASSKPNLAGVTWYVAITGSDSNDCLTTSTPCATIQAAINKASNDDAIYVAIGIYNAVQVNNKPLTLLGGWDSSFLNQIGHSTINGQNLNRGIHIINSSPITIDRFIVTQGKAYQGAGILSFNSTVTLSNLIVHNNFSEGNSFGGGIHNNGTITINNSLIYDNSANGGGGVYVDTDSNTTINNSSIHNNIARQDQGYGLGGGIYASYVASFTINNSTINNNNAIEGGGIYRHLDWDPFFYLNSVTISGNQAYDGGGISGDAVYLQNSILANNVDSIGSGNCTEANAIMYDGYSIEYPSGCNWSGQLPINQNPRLGIFSQGYYPLTFGSPAIDAGSSNCLATDQRGAIRPQGNACDIGAYEGSVPWEPNPLVNTFTVHGGSSLPGSFLCNQTQTNCTNGIYSDADAVHFYTIGVYNFYASQHNRDSIDNNGMTITSSVRYCHPNSCPYDNAFWSGNQLVYGDANGYAYADDIVAHEYTHGVTQYESNLFYYYQSGAINESFSDVWGEWYDQENGLGNDTSGVKWLVGEDVSGVGAFRSMSNPPTYGDPDKMTSPYYYTQSGDNGGVHYNSGVNNKAVYLMVDGGTFNNKTVSALGWEKTGKIYYEAQTNLLTSGSDYSDLYYALQQACTNLVGQHGITVSDCTEVKDALDAVEMNLQPVANFNTDAPLCAIDTPVYIATDDFESGLTNWSFTNSSAYSRWQLDSPLGPFAKSGQHSLYADDYPASVTDASAQWKPVTVPNNAYLHFAHAYEFEYFGSYYYDGGVLEYSTNGGYSWIDAGTLMDFNGYDSSIFVYTGNNPLEGRSAFVGSSHGYISTRLNLASLAGQNVIFRWRMGLDESVSGLGWWVDDIKVYACGSGPIFSDVPTTHPYFSDIEILYANGFTAGCSTSPLMFCPDTTMNRGQAAVFMLRGNFGSGYTPPAPPWNTFLDDFSPGPWAQAWVQGMFNAGLTAGCSSNPMLYCPWEEMSRVQVAVFSLRLMHGSAYFPPPASGSVFADITDPNLWYAKWAEQAYADGLLPACGSSGGQPLFCPNDLVTRGLGAFSIVKAKNLTLP